MGSSWAVSLIALIAGATSFHWPARSAARTRQPSMSSDRSPFLVTLAK
ncbi:hypothetical protein M2165_002775 [Variovorax sp. TBS-050B]|nr:hypothetical protein [Variovorax sp. TBS-050B]